MWNRFITIGLIALPLVLLWIAEDNVLLRSDPACLRPGGCGNVGEGSRAPAGLKPLAPVLALYFPQFHEFEVNNRLHGQGYTDFAHIPELTGARWGFPVVRPLEGFYNLVETHVRRRHAEYAKAHNIHGFIYYHYWFKGAPVMDAPLEAMLKDGEPNLPFAISWANEHWTARWNGGNNDVLMEQTYEAADARPHFDWLLRFWKHPNYILQDGKPLFFVYRIHDASNGGFDATLRQWREWAVEAGFAGLYVVQTNGMKWTPDAYDRHAQADAVMQFFPNYLHRPIQRLHELAEAGPEELGLTKEQYLFGMFTSFNNKPRHVKDDSEAIIVWHPVALKAALKEQLLRSSPRSFVVINAFNEWGEGAALEPSVEFGFAWLQAVKEAVDEVATGRPLPHVPPAGIAPAPLNADNSLCIVVRTHSKHDDTAMFPLRRMLQTLVSLEHKKWEAVVVDVGQEPFDQLAGIVGSFRDPRMRLGEVLPHLRQPVTGSLAAYGATDFALEEFCVKPGTARWMLATNGDHWYAPDAFNAFPPEADKADMQLLNFYGRHTLVGSMKATKASPANCCSRLASLPCFMSMPVIGSIDLAAILIRTASWKAAGLSFSQFSAACSSPCNDGALVQHVDKELQWKIAYHPAGACALHRSGSHVACAAAGGYFWDDPDAADSQACMDPFSVPPLAGNKINWFKFATTDGCVCES